MKKRFFSLFVIALVYVTTCMAQQNLFSWQNGSVIACSDYIIYDTKPFPGRNAESSKLLNTFSVSSKNNQYLCYVKIVGTKGITEDIPGDYAQFELRDHNNRLFYGRLGTYGLYSTIWLSSDHAYDDYFQKIDLDNNSYALIFAGDYLELDDILGEMIIVVVSKNVATLVYDGPAAAITPTDFDSDSFSMDFVTDGTDLIDPVTGLLQINSAKLAGRTKYRIYKNGNVLKIASWVSGNGPVLP